MSADRAAGARLVARDPARPGRGLSHGLYACAAAAALGSESVSYLDSDERRRSIAAVFGARTVAHASDLHGHKFPVTVDTAGDPAGLVTALEATAPGGHCHSVGIYFSGARVPLGSMYMDSVTFTTGRPEINPHAQAVLDLLASGAIDPAPVFSDTLAFDDLPSALPNLPAKPLVMF